MKRFIIRDLKEAQIVLSELRGKTITENCVNLEPKKEPKGSEERKNEVQNTVNKNIVVPVVVKYHEVKLHKTSGVIISAMRIECENRFVKIIKDICDGLGIKYNVRGSH